MDELNQLRKPKGAGVGVGVNVNVNVNVSAVESSGGESAVVGLKYRELESDDPASARASPFGILKQAAPPLLRCVDSVVILSDLEDDEEERIQVFSRRPRHLAKHRKRHGKSRIIAEEDDEEAGVEESEDPEDLFSEAIEASKRLVSANARNSSDTTILDPPESSRSRAAPKRENADPHKKKRSRKDSEGKINFLSSPFLPLNDWELMG